MLNVGVGRLLQFGILLLLLMAPLRTQAEDEAQNDVEWRDASDNLHDRSDLERILSNHRIWIKQREETGEGEQADFTRAQFIDTNLAGMNLREVILRKAVLLQTNLRGADLTDAVLSGAHFDGTDLDGANLSYAELRGAFFEPKSLPELRGIAAGRNLETLTYKENPDALAQLRKKFEDGGFREQERKITYALKRKEAKVSCEKCTSRKAYGLAFVWSSDSVLANCGSYVLNRVFFDWTCQYGMSPGRPLIFGTMLWLICSFLYFACLQQSGKTGLYRVYKKRLDEGPTATPRFEKISLSSIRRFRGRQRPLQFLQDEWLLLRASMFFSLMSAFNIGFRDINFGRWLRLLTRQEFDIKAVGWARIVAGW